MKKIKIDHSSELLKGIVSWDFDGVFMALSFSLHVRHVPLHIILNFMFLYLNFITRLKSLSRLIKTQ
jgi:hypothetical protein